jgi:hypothetical protein
MSAICSTVKASAGPRIMCPALWMTTSRRPVSAMICLIAVSTEAWLATSISTARRVTEWSAAYVVRSATAGAFRAVVARMPA